MKKVLWAGVLAFGLAASAGDAWAAQQASAQTAEHAEGRLSGATIFIIRHAEKTGTGRGLSSAGAMRAEAYATYFEHLKLDGRPVHIDSLVASTDSAKSARPRLTLEPLSGATGMPIIQPCSSGNIACLVHWLKAQPARQTTLISWHHSKIERILAALGVNQHDVLPNGRWPSDFFDWVIALHFDKSGHLVPGKAELLHEPMSVDNVVWDAMDHPTIHSSETEIVSGQSKH
ncbi:MAG TPA: hypothetical protein VL752_11110 [Acidisoma sp.]|jgi:hypothetical protein|uniref:hypothetical protein n=1 Tax=Acidisoma sp. TaxID=1872115 RepID=UPI002CBC97BB|nr:hypothetical protein [Acidisoma sp.]HTI01484.1 hypothetical protein [Acidisoma sp.]